MLTGVKLQRHRRTDDDDAYAMAHVDLTQACGDCKLASWRAKRGSCIDVNRSSFFGGNESHEEVGNISLGGNCRLKSTDDSSFGANSSLKSTNSRSYDRNSSCRLSHSVWLRLLSPMLAEALLKEEEESHVIVFPDWPPETIEGLVSLLHTGRCIFSSHPDSDDDFFAVANERKDDLQQLLEAMDIQLTGLELMGGRKHQALIVQHKTRQTNENSGTGHVEKIRKIDECTEDLESVKLCGMSGNERHKVDKKSASHREEKILVKKRKSSEQANVNYQEAMKILRCGVCQLTADSFYPQLRQHYEQQHQKDGTYVCNICQKHIQSTNSFHAHLHVVHRPASLPCSHTGCGKQFKTDTSRQNHELRWHSNHRPIICKVCGEGLSSGTHLESHMRLHRSSSVCDTCGKRFLSPSHLEKHRVVHTNSRPYMCQTCGKTFRDAYTAKECEKRHEGTFKPKPSQSVPWRNREAKYVCDLCGYRTKGKAALDRHFRGKHIAVPAFACPLCTSCFKSKSILESHLCTRRREEEGDGGAKGTFRS